jgi:PAS domain-containing protein
VIGNDAAGAKMLADDAARHALNFKSIAQRPQRSRPAPESEKSAASAIGVRASANVPLAKNRNPVAMLGVHWKDTHAWSARELEPLREVAEPTWAATERARAEAALRGCEERLRLAQLQTGVGIWDRNLRTGRLMWTPELEAICGLEPGTSPRPYGPLAVAFRQPSMSAAPVGLSIWRPPVSPASVVRFYPFPPASFSSGQRLVS